MLKIRQDIVDIRKNKMDDLTALLFEQLMDKESPEVIKPLLEKGADVNAKINTGHRIHTPLTTAIAFYFGTDADIIKLLVEFGANVNPKNACGFTPLFFATLQRNLEAIKILIELGADVNAKNNEGKTALDCAKDSATKEILKKAMTVKRAKKQKPICPYCGSEHIGEYLYGLPIISASLEKKVNEGKIILGGCIITEDSPKYWCYDCEKDFGIYK